MAQSAKKTSTLSWVVFAVLLLVVYVNVKNGSSVATEDRAVSLDKREASQIKDKENAEFDRAMRQKRMEQQLVISEGIAATKSILKDPESAVFKDVFYSKGKDIAAAVCGEVNSKNSYGGFSGFKKFVSAGRSDVTYVEDSHSNFDLMWKKLCLGK